MKKMNLKKGLALFLSATFVCGIVSGNGFLVNDKKVLAEETSTGSALEENNQISDYSSYQLSAPGNLKARAGGSKARLTWSRVNGASGYYIYYRNSDSSVFSNAKKITDPSITSFDKSSLTNGTKYYFAISAYKEVNGIEVEGTISSSVTATPKAVAVTSKAAKLYSTKAKFKKSPAYKKYKKFRSALNYTKTFAIPGMKVTNAGGFKCTTMVPQGITSTKSYFLITAYDSKGVDNSVIYVVSKATKAYITTIALPSKAKVGGIAYDGSNVWVSKGTSVASFPYSFVEEAVNAGGKYKTLTAYTSVNPVNTSASFLGYYNGVLWVGKTNNSASSTMYGYKIEGSGQETKLVQSNTMSVPSKTQGISFSEDGTLYLTRSYRTKKGLSGYISQIRIYEPSYGSEKVLKNSAIATKTLPPKVEATAVYGTYLYTLFSSCRCSTCKYKVDRVAALKISKLSL